MPKYTVQANETLLDIAVRELGSTDVRPILRDERNRGIFATGRTEHILNPGDELWLPDERPAETSGVTVSAGQRNVLVARRRTRPFRVRALGPDGQALVNEEYELRPDQGPTVQGVTDRRGLIIAQLVVKARSVTLAIASREYRVAIGSIDPAHTTAGIQARLRNLGFLFGSLTTNHASAVQEALRVFQATHGLRPTGIGDSATIARLVAAHGD
ncbi:peptidoglycan-binding domain-containing protein [Sandaracinus amylolyticus]|uniref:peptidoglycan-binding domain-containing protein n=1 Tax=Sandaracinus amylolyticus TaxID=927083 RepID=UPI00069DF6EF|nr:peptidoglycan-binding domain-containing protein [Sandaracinus amylolyticus]